MPFSSCPWAKASPILAGEQAIGALGIGNRVERTFTEEETSHLMRLGRAIAARQRS
jgi:signal transduction protein with GAF and PtsI domain